ncbi:Asp-tRNA(Asn)/Glu-tRNA(Gln) amidotransferase GatCAB subunit C [archaeon SCG-AAA382B04]|nr:Asp-tRNA(Asn)/Glu-tRNA(Gln) amidotransferase GatCAB subunit C [archaeon SCG-AAA382B04]
MTEKKLDKETIEKVANLSKLAVEEGELSDFKDELLNILDYFDKLDEANTENVPPTSHVMEIINKMREDEVEKELDNESALKNSSNPQEGYFKGPKVRD